MIERYSSKGIKGLGTTWNCIYEAPQDMNCAFVTSLMVSNTSDRNTTVEAYIKRSDVPFYLTSAETPLPAGSTAAIAALGQRLQLFPGDSIHIRVGRDDSADVTASISEIIYNEYELEQLKM